VRRRVVLRRGRVGIDETGAAALRMCEAFVQSQSEHAEIARRRAFVFVSAEDIFRPFVPARYIESKREAELGIERILATQPGFRGVYIRPSACLSSHCIFCLLTQFITMYWTWMRAGLIYHAHFRPLTTPIAALLDLSVSLHANLPSVLPTPSGVLRTLARASPGSAETLVPPSALDSVANALTIPPIHVDHVAEAICIAADGAREDVHGVYGVRKMRELIGWVQKGQDAQESVAHA
jgi:hypothetical protein